MEVKRVLPSRRDSYERLCHDAGKPRFLLDLSPGKHDALRRRLAEPCLERFIGVIYRPDTELWRTEEHTSEIQSLIRTSNDAVCLKTKKEHNSTNINCMNT